MSLVWSNTRVKSRRHHMGPRCWGWISLCSSQALCTSFPLRAVTCRN
jgi:hypothetical protein